MGLTDLSYLDPTHNQISDIWPLVSNPGIGGGDRIVIRQNFLDLAPGSMDMNHVADLERRGATVYYAAVNPPATPSGLNVVASPGQFVVSWSANTEPDLAGYVLYRNGVRVSSVPISGTSYTDSGLPYSQYGYAAGRRRHGRQLRARRALPGQHLPIDITPPSPPATLTAADIPSDQGGAIDLAWPSATDDAGVVPWYRIYRGTTSGAYDTTWTVPMVTTSRDSSAVTGVRYYYVVAAVDFAGHEARSPETSAIALDNLTPATPSDLAAVGGAGQIALSWSANTEPTSRVTSCTATACGSMSCRIPGTSYTDFGLLGGAYSYQVSARDTNGNESAKSVAVLASPADPAPPSAPATLTAADVTGDEGGAIALAWSAATDDVGVTGYRIRRGTTTGAYDTTWTVSSATSYRDSSAVTGVRYYYVVSALDAGGNEGPSSPEASAIALDDGAPAADETFESGTDGASLAPAWTISGTPQRAEYDSARARSGALSGWIQGPTAATYAGVYETSSAAMTANGAEQRFWLYFDTTNQYRTLDDFAIRDRRPGTLHPVLQQRTDLRPYRPRGQPERLRDGRLHLGGHLHHRLDRVPHRLHLHRHRRPDLHAVQARRAATDPWTPLKGAAATGYGIPFRGVNTISQSHGLLVRAYQNANLWLDDVRYSNAGIGDGPLSDATPPSAPAALTGGDAPSDEGGAIDLSWSAATDNVAVTGYRIRRGTTSGAYDASWTVSSERSYRDSSAATGMRYYYIVSALDAAGNEGPRSPEASAIALDNLAPAPPSGLTAAGGAAQIALSWSANPEPDLVGYELYRDGVRVNAVPIPGTSHTDFGLLYGTYSYEVSAVDRYGNESPKSAAVIATPADPTPPTAPATLTAADVPGDEGGAIESRLVRRDGRRRRRRLPDPKRLGAGQLPRVVLGAVWPDVRHLGRLPMATLLLRRLCRGRLGQRGPALPGGHRRLAWTTSRPRHPRV